MSDAQPGTAQPSSRAPLTPSPSDPPLSGSGIALAYSLWLPPDRPGRDSNEGQQRVALVQRDLRLVQDLQLAQRSRSGQQSRFRHVFIDDEMLDHLPRKRTAARHHQADSGGNVGETSSILHGMDSSSRITTSQHQHRVHDSVATVGRDSAPSGASLVFLSGVRQAFVAQREAGAAAAVPACYPASTVRISEGRSAAAAGSRAVIPSYAASSGAEAAGTSQHGALRQGAAQPHPGVAPAVPQTIATGSGRGVRGGGAVAGTPPSSSWSAPQTNAAIGTAANESAAESGSRARISGTGGGSVPATPHQQACTLVGAVVAGTVGPDRPRQKWHARTSRWAPEAVLWLLRLLVVNALHAELMAAQAMDLLHLCSALRAPLLSLGPFLFMLAAVMLLTAVLGPAPDGLASGTGCAVGLVSDASGGACAVTAGPGTNSRPRGSLQAHATGSGDAVATASSGNYTTANSLTASQQDAGGGGSILAQPQGSGPLADSPSLFDVHASALDCHVYLVASVLGLFIPSLWVIFATGPTGTWSGSADRPGTRSTSHDASPTATMAAPAAAVAAAAAVVWGSSPDAVAAGTVQQRGGDATRPLANPLAAGVTTAAPAAWSGRVGAVTGSESALLLEAVVRSTEVLMPAVLLLLLAFRRTKYLGLRSQLVGTWRMLCMLRLAERRRITAVLTAAAVAASTVAKGGPVNGGATDAAAAAGGGGSWWMPCAAWRLSGIAAAGEPALRVLLDALQSVLLQAPAACLLPTSLTLTWHAAAVAMLCMLCGAAAAETPGDTLQLMALGVVAPALLAVAAENDLLAWARSAYRAAVSAVAMTASRSGVLDALRQRWRVNERPGTAGTVDVSGPRAAGSDSNMRQQRRTADPQHATHTPQLGGATDFVMQQLASGHLQQLKPLPLSPVAEPVAQQWQQWQQLQFQQRLQQQQEHLQQQRLQQQEQQRRLVQQLSQPWVELGLQQRQELEFQHRAQEQRRRHSLQLPDGRPALSGAFEQQPQQQQPHQHQPGEFQKWPVPPSAQQQQQER